MDKRIWGKHGLESSLPHIIVDAEGKQTLPKVDDWMGIPPYFKNRAVATRLLNKLQRQHNPTLFGDPKTWRVQPVREDPK